MIERTKYLHRPNGRILFRVGGKTIERLPDDETSVEFADAYDRLIAELRAGKFGKRGAVGRPAGSVKKIMRIGPERSGWKPPQIGWVIERFLASDHFAPPDKLKPTERPFAPGTQYAYRLGLDILRKALGTALLTDITPRNANLYIQKVKREHNASRASLQKKLLSMLWSFAKNFPEIDVGDRTNPVGNREVKEPYEVRQEHEPWPLMLRERFKAECGENLYLAFHLLLCTGQRRGDVARLKWTDFNDDCTHLRLIQQKTLEEVPIRLPKILVELLQRTERRAVTVVTSAWDRPFDPHSLSDAIKRILKKIERDDPTTKASRYTPHGLRKNAGILLAEGGATELQIMTALGHRTPAMAQYYIRLANKELIAEQNAALFDAAFEREKAAVAAARRAGIRRVK